MKILIVGAGIAGLYKSYKLLNEGHDIVLLEKNDYIGGQLQTLSYQIQDEKYYFDIGPHIPPKNHNAWNFLCDKVDSLSTPLPIKVSLVFKKGVDLIFPPDLDIIRNTKILDLISLGKFLPFYLVSSVYKLKETNLEHSLINSWGLKFYQTYIYNFISTFWKADPREITNEYKARFSPPSIPYIVRKIIENYNYSTQTSVSKKIYPYPKLGTGEVINFLESDILKRGAKIKKNSNILDLKVDSMGFNVKYEQNGNIVSETYDKLFWAGSISDLVRILKLTKYNDLIYRKLLLINLKISQKSLLKPQVHTSYLMIPNVIFHRIYEPKKISHHMAPENKTSACLEITLKSSKFNENEITSKALNQFKSIYNLKDNEVEHLGNFFYEEGYSFLFIDYKKRFKHFLRDVKKKNPNFYFIGRTGQFFPYTLNQTLDSVENVF